MSEQAQRVKHRRCDVKIRDGPIGCGRAFVHHDQVDDRVINRCTCSSAPLVTSRRGGSADLQACGTHSFDFPAASGLSGFESGECPQATCLARRRPAAFCAVGQAARPRGLGNACQALPLLHWSGALLRATPADDALNCSRQARHLAFSCAVRSAAEPGPSQAPDCRGTAVIRT